MGVRRYKPAHPPQFLMLSKLADFDELTLTAIVDLLRHLKTKHPEVGSNDNQGAAKAAP